jgi:hypothetical protein
MQSQRVHLNGFDWLRAFMPWLVVVWHMNTFGISKLYASDVSHYKVNAPDVTIFQTVVLTVPVFILMGSYLAARFPSNWEKTSRRVWRLALLAFFWTFMLTVWKGGYEQLKRLMPESAYDLVIKALSANGEFYYFFVALIFCTLLTFLLTRLPTVWNVAGLVASLALTFFLPQITLITEQPRLLAYWNPLSFLPYPFVAVTLVRFQDRFINDGRKLFVAVVACLAIGGLFLWYEWTHDINPAFFPGNDLSFPLLTRVSLVFHAAAIVLAGLWSWATAPAIIRSMSKLSLGIFVLHAFLRPVVMQNFPMSMFPNVEVARLAQTGLVILFCYVLALVMPLFVRDDLVR